MANLKLTHMQYIKKQDIQPVNWDNWFTKATGARSYDYKRDNSSMTNLKESRRFLLNEQDELCAYCQQKLDKEDLIDSSIEHVTPKGHNKELSTNYHNLVAVCKSPTKDPETGRLHCDKERGSLMISPIIFYSNSDVTETKNNRYFNVFSDGNIVAKHSLPESEKKQVEAFIEVLNLNHKTLREKRTKDILDGWISAFHSIPRIDPRKNLFWKVKFDNLLLNKKQPFRQFLLIYLGNKIGLN